MKRLVQKEKEVVLLQAEVDRCKVQNPVEDRELVSAVVNPRRILDIIFIQRRKERRGTGIESSGIL